MADTALGVARPAPLRTRKRSSRNDFVDDVGKLKRIDKVLSEDD